MIKPLVLYTFAVAALLLVAGWLLTLGFSGAENGAAIRLSAVVVLVVQLAVFVAMRLAPRKHVVAAWGAGALARLLTLGVFALLVVKVLMLPVVAALISMAAFFFVTTLIEPLFLKS
jgi:hypothetical protein